MTEFNETIFLNTVASMNKISPAFVSEPCAKNLLSLAGFQCGFSQSDVLRYIQKVGESLIEGFKDATFDAKGWNSLYSYVVKDGICPELQLTDFGNYKKKTADELELNFNNVISKWHNPSVLKQVFKIDSLYAWTWMLQTIISMAEGKIPEYITVAELLSRHEVKKREKEARNTGSRTDSSIKSVSTRRPGGKFRCRKSVGQYALNGTLIEIYSTPQEAADKNENFKKATILHCLNGHSHTAYGYKWQWVDESLKTETPIFSKLNKLPATTSLACCQDFIEPDIEIIGNSDISYAEDDTPNNSNEHRVLVAFFLNDKKEIDFSRKIGMYKSQAEACLKLGINKGTLCNYMKGRKKSIWFHHDGKKTRIGFQMRHRNIK